MMFNDFATISATGDAGRDFAAVEQLPIVKDFFRQFEQRFGVTRDPSKDRVYESDTFAFKRFVAASSEAPMVQKQFGMFSFRKGQATFFRLVDDFESFFAGQADFAVGSFE